jgi:hypothetical protein
LSARAKFGLSREISGILFRMKKNDRRGGPVSKIVMAALVLASTAGFVSGLSRTVVSEDGLPGWFLVRELFARSLPGQLITTFVSSNSSAPRPVNTVR